MIKFNFPAMLLLTYTPRKDVDLEKYENWLREVDNPFFNNVKGISHYTNWKIINKNINLKFSYFDFLAFENINLFDSVWNSKEVVDFTASWRKLWGQAPNNEDLSLNAMVYLLENTGNQSLIIDKQVSINFSLNKIKFNDHNQLWKLNKSIRNEAFFNYFVISKNKSRLSKSFWADGEIVASP